MGSVDTLRAYEQHCVYTCMSSESRLTRAYSKVRALSCSTSAGTLLRTCIWLDFAPLTAALFDAEVRLLVRRLQAAEAAAAEGAAKSSALRAGMQDMGARNGELAAQLQACQRDGLALLGRYRHVSH